jgi:hypothetical protein
MTYSDDFQTLEAKLTKATDYRTTTEVDLGDASVEIRFRLPSAPEQDPVDAALPIDEIDVGGEETGLDDEDRERLQELREIREADDEELSDDQETEFVSLVYQSPAIRLFSNLDRDQKDVIRELAKVVIVLPDDIADSLYHELQEVEFASLDERLSDVDWYDVSMGRPSREQCKRIKRHRLFSKFEASPYDVLFEVGLNAYMEARRATGNGLPDEETSTH